MKYFLLISLLIFSGCKSSAQNLRNNTEPCNCEIAFQDLIEKLEDNYIALAQMELAGDDSAYEARKILYTEQSAETEANNCTAFLDDFLSFFEDGHLSVSEYPNYSEKELSEFKRKIKESLVNSDLLEQMMSNESTFVQSASDNILGIWTDGKSDILVVNVKDIYRAYILKSNVEGIEPGELKAILSPTPDGFKVEYYSYSYTKRYIRGGIYKEGQFFRASNVFWIRKESNDKRELKWIDKTNFNLPRIAKLDEKNTLLSLPSFNLDYDYFNDLINENENLIINSENLIIDIRGNRGGNGIYFPLIELFATQNMEGSQGFVLASSDNLEYFERQVSWGTRGLYKPVIKRMNENMGGIVDGPAYPEKKFKVQESRIKNVAILTDKSSASAAESFILHSKRSSTKVQTFGGPTEGMIDYTSVNSVLLNSGKQYIYFRYPTGTLHKQIPNNGYNKTGIVPDVPISADVEDKVDFVMKYFE